MKFTLEKGLKSSDSESRLKYLFYLVHGEIMCTKTCTKMVETDSAGLGRIPLDSLEKYGILPLKYVEMRPIPTLMVLASKVLITRIGINGRR